MSDQFQGEIRMFGCAYAPSGWAKCDGQLLQIAQNQLLFTLLGTLYGGDGVTTFALPDLRGRVPIHFNATYPQGHPGGEELHALTANEMPSHSHAPNGVTANAVGVDQSSPKNNHLANSGRSLYAAVTDGATMNGGTAGGNQAHENRSPFAVLNFCIALEGESPVRS
jgi:microcystin-dependent protein